MDQSAERVRHLANPKAFHADLEAAAAERMAELADCAPAIAEITRWPGYAATPLHDLKALAQSLGLGQLLYKDESQRFGRALASFKALGAPYAVLQLLQDHVQRKTGERPTSEALRAGAHRDVTREVTVCVATDGNQGRGLAWGAQTFGCRCVVFIHEKVSEGRATAMARFGAEVVRVAGEYEQSVARARKAAAEDGWHMVTSTSWGAYAGIPRDVMLGYMTMIEESLDQLPPDPLQPGPPPTHLFMQAGVGSIPAAILAAYHRRFGERMPRFIVVEPHAADCVYQSVHAGRPMPAAGSLRTIMAGLACREVSPAAWSILHWGARDAVTISEAAAVAAMRVLAQGGVDWPPIVAGESAVGGLAVLLAAADDAGLRQALGLDDTSRVLLFGCEGATDPAIYEALTGFAPDAVFERQAVFVPPRRAAQ